MNAMYEFTATIEIIGVNPYVFVPGDILQQIFLKAGKSAGPIPVRGSIQGMPYAQTLVRYAGEWRLYINMKMLKNSPQRVGEEITISIEYDPSDRLLPLNPVLEAALLRDKEAQATFDSLSPSRRHEINRYISGVKSEEKILENVQRAIEYLHGNAKFVGRHLTD